MDDPIDPIDRARAAVKDRADLPGMSLMEHLEELRKRLIHAVAYLLIGFAVAYAFHEKLYGYIQKPLDDQGILLNYTHPTDPLNLYLKTAFVGGFILASPFILYQVWLFISPGMYANEKKYVFPFMGATVALFLSGAWFGYHWVLPGALKFLIGDFGKKFHPIITIEDYTGFFLAVILGLGITFELPILIFFLALFGIVDGKFLIKHIRYAILAIFIIAAIICPTPDPVGMCIFASPMLVLYLIGVGVAFLVHPDRRRARENKAG
ncbi:twin-arginine translocase subunit TatC [Granulicella sibirica]|uniref:Sec-independent protein translocase protein TatC n=1 Tax=Granulicella sibirica TaxID=2479048 RepID=A0A4Q0SZ20_9BACT|nr:twin-arginine translocase subunit TatC [Granulicella sibirica]RXH55250.1 Twin-arginine translocation protein TatC [Granulicella sibirica]